MIVLDDYPPPLRPLEVLATARAHQSEHFTRRELADRRSSYKQCSLAGGSLALRLVARSLDPGAGQQSLGCSRDHLRRDARVLCLKELIALVIEVDIHIPLRATLLLLALLLPYVRLG